MHIQRVDLKNGQHIRAFLTLPHRLYRGNRQWVPPLFSDERRILDPEAHPFYEHSEAAFFIAEDEGEVRGRIGVMDNRRYNEHMDARMAFFGYFECSDDVRVSRALFDAGFEWARQRGLTRVMGPRTLVGTNAGGLLVKGFDLLPAMGISYNLPYYEALLRDVGLEKRHDLLSGHISGDSFLPARVAKLVERVRKRSGITVVSPDGNRELGQWVRRVAHVYVEAFSTNDYFCPPTQSEIDLFARQIISIADPRLIKVAVKDNEPVGFVVAYPNIGRGLQRAGGRLWPLGWLSLMIERRRTRYLDINGLGILPEYRGRGVNALMYSELGKTIKALGYEHLELVQVRETNYLSRNDQEALGAEWTKRHRVFERPL